MSRRPPSDSFTRFTSTSPHAAAPLKPASSTFTAAQPGSSSRPLNAIPNPRGSNQAGPPGETPAERVARLRAANRLAKERASLSPVDRIIARGRTVADTAHRVTTYGLLAFTGVSAVIAVYGLTSLISHNRRQKRAWIEREMGRLQDAQQAFLRGEANAEQLHLLEQERAGEEMAKKFQDDKARRKEAGAWSQVKGMFDSAVSKGEMGGESSVEAEARQIREGGREKLLEEAWIEGDSSKSQFVETRSAAVRESKIAGVALDSKGRPVPANKVERVVRDIDQERRTGEKEVTARTGITGGPLDVLAGNVVSSASRGSQSWWSWATGGGKS